MKDFIDFLKNHTVQKNILSAFGSLFVFILIIFLSLRVYTHHGQAITVPDFVGLNMDAVNKITHNEHPTYEICSLSELKSIL